MSSSVALLQSHWVAEWFCWRTAARCCHSSNRLQGVRDLFPMQCHTQPSGATFLWAGRHLLRPLAWDLTPPTWAPGSWTQGGHSLLTLVLGEQSWWDGVLFHFLFTLLLTCITSAILLFHRKQEDYPPDVSVKNRDRDWSSMFHLCSANPSDRFYRANWVVWEFGHSHVSRLPSCQCWHWLLWRAYTDPFEDFGLPLCWNWYKSYHVDNLNLQVPLAFVTSF